MNKDFINSIEKGALKGQLDYNILPSLTIAQAILESGWGKSKLTQIANNLFGVKAFSDWKGRRVTMATTEYYNGKKVVVNADFRAYDNLNDSIEDHNKLLTNSRYRAVRECSDYKTACQKIYECGYATDPNYPAKLISIIEDNNLDEFDSINALDEASIGKEDSKILKFQKLCNKLNFRDSEGKALVEDNLLGSKTRSCIAKMPLIKTGSSGIVVEFVQETVGVMPIDGIFGPKTKSAVMVYQKGKGITVDGIVGKETWSVMITT